MDEAIDHFFPHVYSVITIVMCVMFSFGFIIQIIALLVFTRKTFREMKLTALFVNVIAANLIILLVEGPLLVTSSSHGQFWPAKSWVCNLRGFTCGAASINMIVSLLCIVTKLISLVKSANCNRWIPSDSCMIAVSWVYSVLCMLPPLFGWSKFHIDPSGLSCAIDWWTQTVGNVSYVVILSVMAFLLPVSYLAFNLYTLREYFQNQQNSASGVVNRHREAYRSKMNMVLLASMMFVLFWLPYCVCGILSIAGKAHWFTRNAISVVPSLIAKSSCIYAPILYCLSNQKFRSAFLGVITCGLFKRNCHVNSTAVVETSKRDCNAEAERSRWAISTKDLHRITEQYC